MAITKAHAANELELALESTVKGFGSDEERVASYRRAIEIVGSHVRAVRNESAPIDLVHQILTLLGYRRTVSNGAVDAIDRSLSGLFRRAIDLVPVKERRSFLDEASQRVPESSHLSRTIGELQRT